jgi:hypothetical protein
VSVQTIWDLKMFPHSQTPLYYPPGQHPATERWRAHLALLLELGFGDDYEGVVYLRETLAAFEEVESERKQRDDWILRNR